jgi:hypothetical protein
LSLLRRATRKGVVVRGQLEARFLTEAAVVPGNNPRLTGEPVVMARCVAGKGRSVVDVNG